MSLRLAFLVSLAASPLLHGDAPWSVARDGNIEVYSHRNAAEAGAALAWLEQLRSILKAHLGLDLPGDRPLSVFGFASTSEYEPYRLRATSDAYYVGTDGRDYIVLPTLGARSLGTAAHEFAHLASHAAGASLPPWLSEGLADVFSTIHVTRSGPQLGGEPFGRLAVLQARRWLPMETLLSLPADSPLRNSHPGSDVFYAQSWALTEMLLMSPQYATRFPRVVLAFSNHPAAGRDALETAAGKPLPAITRDLQNWVRRHKSRPVALEAAPAPDRTAIRIAEIPDAAVQTLLGAMLLSAGDLGGAESVYRRAEAEAPEDPAVLGGLAAIAMARGRSDESRALFTKALARGLADADLCYHYSVLLDRSDGSVQDRRAALSRAVELRPGFDDARYALALLEKNAGNEEAAVADLRAMRMVAPGRAFHYWLAMADALIAIGRNDEAAGAAKKAGEFASDAEQRAHAADLAHIAQTHLAVRFARDASGRLQLVTTRAPNDGGEWNPFVEPTDDIRRVQGKLREIDCSGPATRLVIDTAAGTLVIAIPDPTHVQMRNAPPEFVCGPQTPADITILYAAGGAAPHADGIARGLEFR